MKTFWLLFASFLIYSFTSFAQDTSLAVTSNGSVGIGTASPAAKLEVNSGGDFINTVFTTSSVASAISFHNSYNNAGEVMVGAQANDLRLITNGADRMAVKSDGKVGIGTLSPASELDVNGTVTVGGKLNRYETDTANLAPIAYANVNSDGTINTVATTDNVTLSSHSAGSGNYYFTIAGYNVLYSEAMCIATLRSGSGEISWSSAGGGATLYIGTKNSSGVAEDKNFTFIVYKK
jgi:hypothetical protein